MSYKRVIPRDLFNESKLLKCIGKISLLILDRKILGLKEEFEGDAFNVVQGPSGEISISNLRFTDSEGNEVYFYTPLNARDNWPLEMEYKGELYYPLNEKGEYQLASFLFEKESNQ